MNLYIGTYTQTKQNPEGRKEGVFRCSFNPLNGKIELLGAYEAGPNPSFIALNTRTDRLYTANRLYAVNETRQFQGNPGGSVSSFAIDPADGSLTLLSVHPTRGTSPCYISLDHSEKWALVANYGSGSLATFPVLEDGSLGALAGFRQHAGQTGPHPTRQEGPHAHSICQDPRGELFLAADLGLDLLLVYRLNRETGVLDPNQPPAIRFHAGSGPRHFAFHPSQPWLYCCGELDSTVTAIKWNHQTGEMKIFQVISMLPSGWQGNSTAADIHFTPNGMYLYASNRGHDSLAAFAVDPSTGALSFIGTVSSGGKTPRNFAIDPSGRWIIVANQNSDNLVIFGIDQSTGCPQATGIELAIPAPVCIQFC